MIRKVSTTLTSDAYTTGDVMGGVLTIERAITSGRTRPRLQQILAMDLSTAPIDIDFIFLSQALSSDTTVTDHAIVALADADLGKVLGVASATATMLFDTNSCVRATDLNIPLEVADFAADTSIYFLPVARGTSPVDWTSIQFIFNFAEY